jgi:hypothetical protein
MKSSRILSGVVALGLCAGSAWAAAPATYCEFPSNTDPSLDLSWLCNSSAISIANLSVVSGTKISVQFSTSQAISAALAGSIQFEMVLSNSKVISNIGLNSGADAAGVLKRIATPTAASTVHNSIQFDPGFTVPFYAFYRIRLLNSGAPQYQSPWKVYSDPTGTPIESCPGGACTPEMLSVRIDKDQWISRVSISQSDANKYNIDLDGTSSLISGTCEVDPNTAYSKLTSANSACYIQQGRIVVLSLSSSPVKFGAIGTVPAELSEYNSYVGGRFSRLFPVSGAAANPFLAAVLDKSTSVDDLFDVFADINIRYGHIGTIQALLGAANTDGTGVLGRNKSWLFAGMTMNSDVQKKSLLINGMAKSLPIQFYYSGRELADEDSVILQRDSFDLHCSIVGGPHIMALSTSTGRLYDVTGGSHSSPTDSDGVAIPSMSTAFWDLWRGGIWIGITKGYEQNTDASGSVQVNGRPIALLSIDSKSSVIKENLFARTYKYENVAGTEKDPLYYKSPYDSLFLHAGSSRQMTIDPRFASSFDSIHILASDSLAKISASVNSAGMSIDNDTSAIRNYKFSVLIGSNYTDSTDQVLIPINGRSLKGVEYVVYGIAAERSNFFINASKMTGFSYRQAVLDSGIEPHVISPYGRGAGMRQIWDSDGLHDVIGLQASDIIDCIDGKPYSARATTRNDCGAPDGYVGPKQVYGVAYFGHGLDASGFPWVGIDLKRLPKYEDSLSACLIPGRKNKCWNASSALFLSGLAADGIPDTSLYSRNARFVAYACLTANDFHRADGSFVSRIAKNWRMTALGDSSAIALRSFDPTLGKKYSDIDLLKYFNPAYGVKLDSEAEKISFFNAIDALVSNSGPGILKVNPIWRHVKFDKCTPVSGGVNCVRQAELISPSFFDVNETP